MANEKRKVGRPKGELSGFVYQKADFSAEDVGTEIDRLLLEAQSAGISTNRTSLAVTFYRLRKDRELKNQTDPPLNHQPRETNTSPVSKPLITAPAKPYQPPIVNPSAESVIAAGDDWFDPQRSVYVQFSENRREDTPPTENGNTTTYIGRIIGRPDGKAVLPASQVVRDYIASTQKQTGKFPVLLPCFLTKKSTYWLAISVDLERLESPRDSPTRQQLSELLKRLQFVESEVMQLRRIVAEVNQRTAIQDLLIIFDFQNFSASFRDRGTPIHPRFIIDKVSHFETLIPRRVIKVVIVDFTSSRGKIYCDGNPDYDFCPVPDITEGEKNPTDQLIYQVTCDYVNKLKLPPGSLVALVSGDGHFLPLLCDLKNAGYQIMTVGREGYIHQSMKDADFCLVLS